MTSKKRAWDVFLSFSRRDEVPANIVKAAFESAELTVFQFTAESHEAGEFDDVRQALAESEAVVAIISEHTRGSSWIAVEVGAAWAWQKALYIVRADDTDGILPLYLRGLAEYPINRIDELITRILEAKEPLTTEHSDWLARWYEQHRVPLDEMTIHPASLDSLTADFGSQFGLAVPAERLLKELYRLRKRGDLPRVKRSKAV
ncbi:MAG: TIR domain-containing protein [Phycisphaerales bacterium]